MNTWTLSRNLLRKLPPVLGEKRLYLTFDDGPSPESTEQVLQLLNKHQVQATFFVVVKKAQAHPELFSQIRAKGHAIGDHSLDHSYRFFFSSKEKLRQWVLEGHAWLSQKLGYAPVFRPPAGVVTPPLVSVLKELQIPLVLWNVRFFDTVFTWDAAKALKRLDKISDGSIILLHDAQRPERLPQFLQTLDLFIQRAKELGYRFSAIPQYRDGSTLQTP